MKRYGCDSVRPTNKQHVVLQQHVKAALAGAPKVTEHVKNEVVVIIILIVELITISYRQTIRVILNTEAKIE